MLTSYIDKHIYDNLRKIDTGNIYSVGLQQSAEIILVMV
jgi:hypothetical protein